MRNFVFTVIFCSSISIPGNVSDENFDLNQTGIDLTNQIGENNTTLILNKQPSTAFTDDFSTTSFSTVHQEMNSSTFSPIMSATTLTYSTPSVQDHVIPTNGSSISVKESGLHLIHYILILIAILVIIAILTYVSLDAYIFFFYIKFYRF